MPKIHSSAIIHPKAQLSDDCQIGPYCTIGEHVVLGPGCRLISHVVIDGHTTIGQGNEIFPFACIGMKTQDLKWKGGTTYTRIGDFNTIRESVTVNSATADGETTTIGSHNHILASAHVAHNCTLGNHIIMSNYVGLAGHITVEDYAVMGGMAAFHQFIRIGTMSITGGCSKVTQDVPPYMLVDGNPAEVKTINKVGLERRGVSDAAQSALKQACKILFREGLTIPNALARVESDVPNCAEIKHLIEFFRSTQRGVTK